MEEQNCSCSVHTLKSACTKSTRKNLSGAWATALSVAKHVDGDPYNGLAEIFVNC